LADQSQVCSGSNCENLDVSKCFPILPQQRTFVEEKVPPSVAADMSQRYRREGLSPFQALVYAEGGQNVPSSYRSMAALAGLRTLIQSLLSPER
jgi:hypothetical protein